MDRVALLIDVLLDQNAREDERDDAAMDLAEFDDDRALNALVEVASSLSESSLIVASCGESIGQIVSRGKIGGQVNLNGLRPEALSEIRAAPVYLSGELRK
ncbi:MAG: hypothetical protein RIR70_563 [Pseudomonadota bacterium]|jgi:HEAT repeat protein